MHGKRDLCRGCNVKSALCFMVNYNDYYFLNKHLLYPKCELRGIAISVCRLAYLKNRMSKLYESFCTRLHVTCSRTCSSSDEQCHVILLPALWHHRTLLLIAQRCGFHPQNWLPWQRPLRDGKNNLRSFISNVLPTLQIS